MKFTLAWLKDHLETDAPLDEIAERADQLGLEVEGVEDPADGAGGVLVAPCDRRRAASQCRPAAVCMVDTGDGDRCRSSAARPTRAPA